MAVETLRQSLNSIIDVILNLLGVWWWVILPIVLYFILKPIYLYWIWFMVFEKEKDWVLFEIIPPAETEKPFKAMEDIFTRLWPIYDGPTWREVWCQGEYKAAFYYSWEIVSFEGNVHFYLRIEKGFQKYIEGAIQAHYPQTEIFEVEDYVGRVPPDIPNEKYDLKGEDYVYRGGGIKPIKTYKYFEPAAPEAVLEEKKIDPIYTLLEAMTKLGKGEQFWLQINCVPIENETGWREQLQKEINEKALRPGKTKDKSITGEAARLLILGKVPYEEEKKEEPMFPPEMRLTPGERESLMKMEEKKDKYAYKVNMRVLYIAERDKQFAPHNKIFRSYLIHFGVPGSNFLMYWPPTRTRVHYWFRDRRLYKRKRSIFLRYVKRLTPKYPDLYLGTSTLGVEELATLFHFPTKADTLPPGVPRITVRKREAPPGIPME